MRLPENEKAPAVQGLFEARPRGFEPLTFGSVDRRSIQLSYGRKCGAADESSPPERRGRDSNPRWRLSPHTRLAGECLQPLGHLSGCPECRGRGLRPCGGG